MYTSKTPFFTDSLKHFVHVFYFCFFFVLRFFLQRFGLAMLQLLQCFLLVLSLLPFLLLCCFCCYTFYYCCFCCYSYCCSYYFTTIATLFNHYYAASIAIRMKLIDMIMMKIVMTIEKNSYDIKTNGDNNIDNNNVIIKLLY